MMGRLSLAALVLVLLAGCSGSLDPAYEAARWTPVAAPTGIAPIADLPRCEWAPVVRVVDGDTIIVSYHGRSERLRYTGIDTPESVKSGTPVQPFALEASAANKDLVQGQTVCLEKDVSERDRYGRLLRYVWLADGRLVQEELLREGLATVSTFPPDVKYVDDRYLPALRAARSAERGMWAKAGQPPR